MRHLSTYKLEVMMMQKRDNGKMKPLWTSLLTNMRVLYWLELFNGCCPSNRERGNVLRWCWGWVNWRERHPSFLPSLQNKWCGYSSHFHSLLRAERSADWERERRRGESHFFSLLRFRARAAILQSRPLLNLCAVITRDGRGGGETLATDTNPTRRGNMFYLEISVVEDILRFSMRQLYIYLKSNKSFPSMYLFSVMRETWWRNSPTRSLHSSCHSPSPPRRAA